MPEETREPEEKPDPDVARETTPTGVLVRRNLALAVPVGAAASFVAIAYLWRAVTTGAVLDWAFCAGLAGVAVLFLVGVVDARTPLLVADELGVRIRLGNQWRGLPWDAVGQVAVEPREGRFRDGRLLVRPHNLGRALDGLDGRARRQAFLNQRQYGAALAVPLGLTTGVSAARERELAERVNRLSRGRADVVALLHEPEEPSCTTETPEVLAPPRRPTLAAGLGTIVSRMGKGRRHDVDVAPEPGGPDGPGPAPAPAHLPAPAVPLRETRRGRRVEIAAAAAPQLAEDAPEAVRRLPEERQLRRPGSVDLEFERVPESNVRPISRMGDPVEPLVIDEFETEPAYDPVIGPELVAARHRVGLSVDELAERTRIRPHVIESIEVDDFAPCGGDVYARGHLRTLARVLGKDPEPLLATFDNRYANAPISARRVFEAELATGMTGSMRSMSGGPNWNLLVGFVLALVLVWGVVRLFAGDPNEMVEQPPPLPQGEQFAYDAPRVAPAARTVMLKLIAVNASTRVQVKDADAKVLIDQTLVLGETTTLRVPARFSVSADDGGALNVRVGKRDHGLLGPPDQPASMTFGSGAAD